jgi:hypothetical protein
LKDPAFQAHILASKQSDQAHKQNASQFDNILSQLSHIQDGEDVCKTVIGSADQPTKLWIRPFPWKQQIVVEGHLCDCLHLDEEGKCTYDEKEGSDVAESVDESPMIVPSKVLHQEEEKESCPLCRFMKKGSCREAFISWDKCMSSLKKDDQITTCSRPTFELFSCMTKDDYYDIMTVNSHHILPALEKAVENIKIN